MKIRITENRPREANDGDITNLIGKVFDVKEEDKEGYYIPIGPTGLYCIRTDECEVVEEEEE